MSRGTGADAGRRASEGRSSGSSGSGSGDSGIEGGGRGGRGSGHPGDACDRFVCADLEAVLTAAQRRGQTPESDATDATGGTVLRGTKRKQRDGPTLGDALFSAVEAAQAHNGTFKQPQAVTISDMTVYLLVDGGAVTPSAVAGAWDRICQLPTHTVTSASPTKLYVAHAAHLRKFRQAGLRTPAAVRSIMDTAAAVATRQQFAEMLAVGGTHKFTKSIMLNLRGPGGPGGNQQLPLFARLNFKSSSKASAHMAKLVAREVLLAAAREGGRRGTAE